jgi:hypothetical protein
MRNLEYPRKRRNAPPVNAPVAKFDKGKPRVLTLVLHYFPLSLAEIARVSEYGAAKYCERGWQRADDGINRYGDAMVRHLLAEDAEGPVDRESGYLHAAHAAWNALARLEIMLRENRDR